jgi:hypothetical protein
VGKLLKEKGMRGSLIRNGDRIHIGVYHLIT